MVSRQEIVIYLAGIRCCRCGYRLSGKSRDGVVAAAGGVAQVIIISSSSSSSSIAVLVQSLSLSAGSFLNREELRVMRWLSRCTVTIGPLIATTE